MLFVSDLESRNKLVFSSTQDVPNFCVFFRIERLGGRYALCAAPLTQSLVCKLNRASPIITRTGPYKVHIDKPIYVNIHESASDTVRRDRFKPHQMHFSSRTRP